MKSVTFVVDGADPVSLTVLGHVMKSAPGAVAPPTTVDSVEEFALADRPTVSTPTTKPATPAAPVAPPALEDADVELRLRQAARVRWELPGGEPCEHSQCCVPVS